jgi:uncharacterized phage protein (TIGR02218 family)
MTFDARELSAQDGRPVELYAFTRGSIVWRYTNADRDQSPVPGSTYASANVRRSNIEQGQELNRSALKLTVPRDLPVAALFHVAPPSDAITLVLSEFHAGDPDLQVVVRWIGRILSVVFRGSDAEITLEPVGTSLRRTGLRRAFQRQCPHVLYGPRCKVLPEDYRAEGEVLDVDGLTVEVAEADAFDDGYFEGGFFEWEIATGVYERRFIFAHIGPLLTLDTPPLGLVATDPARFYPGCDHSLGANGCGRFDNHDNHGGTPYIPLKNPYGPEPVY